jgi:hypothetical protein
MARLKNNASAGTKKRAIILAFDGSETLGYLCPVLLHESETMELLTPEGEYRQLSCKDVKAVYFVRDLEAPATPERKTFLSRPKLEGLWVRLEFRDGDVMEGIVPQDLLEMLEKGIFLTPPNMSGNTQRVYVPRKALQKLQVLGVVGAARRAPAKPAIRQPGLFEE